MPKAKVPLLAQLQSTEVSLEFFHSVSKIPPVLSPSSLNPVPGVIVTPFLTAPYVALFTFPNAARVIVKLVFVVSSTPATL